MSKHRLDPRSWRAGRLEVKPAETKVSPPTSQLCSSLSCPLYSLRLAETTARHGAAGRSEARPSSSMAREEMAFSWVLRVAELSHLLLSV